ncbi:MAG TPA: D-glycero-beta-D-manno-heptose 1,7-bisphosphate 7-phosphatase [Candidatus Nanoarchaeia archaeon]|nr:D-glycero-beta-D-manno-heptose 1,7-bisphosphate 7-phosphatase [Candidatus Nanoarchaeia archaeon]
MNKAVFLDRDGTINVDDGYIYEIEKFRFITRSAEAIKVLKNSGLKVIIVTNQSGVGQGLYKEEDVKKVHTHMVEELKKKGVKIDDILYCPHTRDAGCECRKPNMLMVKKSAEKFGLNLKECYVVGDKNADVALGNRAGCKSILVKTGYSGKDKCEATPDYTAEDLYEAASWIIGQENKK